MNAKELLRQYQAGERNFQQVNLTQVILKNTSLPEINFSQAILAEADFSDGNLKQAIFYQASLNP
ncbi:pentapeptide repeat-containing protein [Pleurocapsa sp. FMAR1]|uniref:pentapeptide repeat-containing protein n=1 Tax=Pleurocapsa sp. FMAR1 TaxID=3040204 RepID=UPI0029C78690|nr:pentapeptide repeat-containing protein [Pleurocapsa sp. FMAR1]